MTEHKFKTHYRAIKSEAHRYKLKGFYGNCLERVGIVTKGRALIDRGAEIYVGDLVWCSKYAGGTPGCFKQVKSIEPDLVTVQTAYNDPSDDIEFAVEEIYGVVISAYTEVFGDLMYSRKIYHYGGQKFAIYWNSDKKEYSSAINGCFIYEKTLKSIKQHIRDLINN